MAEFPTEVMVGAVYRLVALMFVVFVGFAVRKKHHWPVGIAVFFGVASNIAFLMGSLRWSGLFSVPYIGLVCWVMIDYMRHDTVALRGMLGKKEAAWSRERHDLISDAAAVRAVEYAQKLEVQNAADERGDDQNARGRRQDRRQDRQDDRQVQQDARDFGSVSEDDETLSS